MYDKQLKNPDGFTLLELLIAISVFAIMSFMAYGGLSHVITNSQASEEALDRLHKIQMAMFNIERDLTQITERTIRDEFGTTKDFIEAGNNSEYLIELTRNGRRNPANLTRSNLVRVAYKLEEGNLSRMQWPHLDRVQGMEPYGSLLLTDVESIDIRFLDENDEWHSDWPPATADATPAILSAIEYTTTLYDWGTIRRLFKVNN